MKGAKREARKENNARAFAKRVMRSVCFNKPANQPVMPGLGA